VAELECPRLGGGCPRGTPGGRLGCIVLRQLDLACVWLDGTTDYLSSIIYCCTREVMVLGDQPETRDERLDDVVEPPELACPLRSW
jgi:hypothetical protein